MRIRANGIKCAVFAAALIAGVAASTSGLRAAPVYSENFDNVGFRGTPFIGQPQDNNNDKYINATIDFFHAADFNGWTFSGSDSGGTFMNVHNTDNVDGAVLLNENGPGTATKSLTGLTPNTAYLLSFLYYGDNRPGQTWGLHVDVNGAILDLSDTDKTPGTNPGTIATLLFLSDGTGAALLSFAQTTPGGSEASPIFDDVQVAATPIPAALPLFAGGLGMLGLLARRRKRKAASAVC
jgi:hypothetical protein